MPDNVFFLMAKGVFLNLGAAVAGALGGGVTAFIACWALGIESQVLLAMVFAFFMIAGALMKVFPDGVPGDNQ